MEFIWNFLLVQCLIRSISISAAFSLFRYLSFHNNDMYLSKDYLSRSRFLLLLLSNKYLSQIAVVFILSPNLRRMMGRWRMFAISTISISESHAQNQIISGVETTRHFYCICISQYTFIIRAVSYQNHRQIGIYYMPGFFIYAKISTTKKNTVNIRAVCVCASWEAKKN